jgi:transcriptional regulator with XRE-family HTH domain
MSVKFGNRLKKARKAKNLTQKQLAESIGINQKQYQHWERGRAEPSFDKVRRLAYMLETDIEWILFGNGKLITNNRRKKADLFRRIDLFLQDNPRAFTMTEKIFELFISEYRKKKSK